MRFSRLLRPVPVFGLLAALAIPMHLSDPIGVFALIDRVVLEPTDDAPQRIQIWGVFALAERSDPNTYQVPQRGYLYYTLGENERAVLAEWNDLKSIAGSNQPVGFSNRYTSRTRIRPASEKPADPDRYTTGFGLVKVVSPTRSGGVAPQLLRVPLPTSPTDGATVPSGAVRLSVRNIPDSGADYMFEIVGPDGAREASAAIKAGKGETSWSPRLQLRGGASYTWRVWTVSNGDKGAPASSVIKAQ